MFFFVSSRLSLFELFNCYLCRRCFVSVLSFDAVRLCACRCSFNLFIYILFMLIPTFISYYGCVKHNGHIKCANWLTLVRRICTRADTLIHTQRTAETLKRRAAERINRARASVRFVRVTRPDRSFSLALRLWPNVLKARTTASLKLNRNYISFYIYLVHG